MNKTRVYQLAKELNMSNKELLDKMAAMKIEAHNHMSTIEEADVSKLKSKGGKPSDQDGKDNKSIVNVAIKQSVRHVVHGIQGVGAKGQNHGDEKRDEIKDLKVTVLEEAKRPAKAPVKAKTQPKHEEVHESKERVTRIPAAAKQEAAEHEHHERKGMRIPAAVAHASEQHEPAKQEAVQHAAPVTPNKPMESTDLVKEKQPVHEKTAEVKTEAKGHREAVTEVLAKPQPKEDVKPAAVVAPAPAPTPASVEIKEASTPKVEPAKAPVQGQAAAAAPAQGQSQNQPQNQPQSQPQTQRPYTPREGQTGGQGQRPYTPRDGQQGQRPYTPRDGQTGTQGQRPYTPRDGQQGQQGQRPYTPRDGQTGTQGQRPYTPRDGQQGQRPYTPREGQTGTQGQRPYTPRDGQTSPRPYTPRDGQTGTQGQRPYTPRDGQTSPRPYTPRDGSRPYTPRPAGSGGYGDRKPGAPAGDKDRTYPPGTARPKRPAAKVEGDTSLPYADRASISGHTKHVKKDDVKKKVEDKNINKKKMLLTTGQHSMQRTEVRRGKKYKKDKQKQIQLKEMDGVIENQAAENLIKVQGSMTVGAFATILDKPATDIILKLMNLGIMATINKDLDIPTLEILAADYDYVIESVEPEKDEDLEAYEFEDAPEDLVKRPPIVTVMGHVDHGKTSLLDAIRNTRITTGEAGGITQHIGASEVFLKNEKIVFLDTPGHEAFTTLRARGAKVTDIAILVVAADDGVMPQTMEAIDHARAAKVPIIIAINKIDKANANPDRVKQELADYGLLVEDWGGDIVSCEVSALKGQGIDTLLEMVLLVAEIQDLKANPNRAANGTIIDAKVEKGRGTVATVIVQNGTLNIGDAIVVGPTYGKIKAMYNDSGKTVKAVMPSSAVEIIGLNEIPNAGDKFYVVANEKVARSIAEKRSIVARESSLNATNHITLEDLFSEIQKGSVKDLNIVVKADVQGSVEALKSSLLKITNEEVRINVIHASVGTITESDVLLASASNAIIIGFNVRPVSVVSQMADKERVAIKTYRIIYEAINDVEAAMKGMLDPIFKEVVIGKVEVRATFKVPNIGVIAGGYVIEGKVTRNAGLRLVREGIVIHEGKVSSLKRFKDDAKEVLTNFECGIGIENYNDLREGDIIEAFINEEVKR